MYEKSAAYYDALYSFKDYGAAAVAIREMVARTNPSARRLLDVACGTGRHLEVLRQWYEVEGLDINERLLDIARERLPGVALHRADMTDYELNARFDIVTCLFSSIAYAKTPANLRSTIASCARHLATDGILIVEPFFSRENYWTGRVTMNAVDEPDLKIAWMYTSDEPVDDVATLDIHYLVGAPERVEHFRERHELGLFSQAQYEDAFHAAGLDVQHDSAGFFGRGVYFGTRSGVRA